MTGADRGQAYTLEGLVSAMLIVSAVLFGLQAVDVAPYQNDSDQSNLESLRTQVGDTLRLAASNGTLTRAVTCLNTTSGGVHSRVGLQPNVRENGSYSPNFDNVTDLGYILNETLANNGYEYRVYFDYWNYTTDRLESALVYPDAERPPTGETVTARYRVMLFDSTNVARPVSAGDQRAFCQYTSKTLEARGDSSVYLSEIPGPNDPELFAIVDVRVVAW